MDEILKYIYPSAIEAARQQQQEQEEEEEEQQEQQQEPTNENPTIDDVAGGDDGTIEDLLVRAGAVPAPHQYPSSDTSHSHQLAIRKQKAVKETLDLPAIQKEEKKAKQRGYVASFREREKARNTETENLVKDLKIENKRLLDEQAEKEKQRLKMLKESVIPVTEQRKPKKKLRRTKSDTDLLS